MVFVFAAFLCKLFQNDVACCFPNGITKMFLLLSFVYLFYLKEKFEQRDIVLWLIMCFHGLVGLCNLSAGVWGYACMLVHVPRYR